MDTKTKKRPARHAAAPPTTKTNVVPILSAPTVLDVSSPVTVELVINNELPKTFDEAVKKTGDLFDTGKTLVLLHVWEIGRINQAVHDDTKTLEGKYGGGTVDKMAEELDIGARILREMMKFYRTYPEVDDVKTLGLEWSSVREIMRLPTDTDRTRVAKTAQKGSLTVREVRTAVNDIKAKEVPKKPKTPKKPPKAVTYFEKLDAVILTALQNIRIVLEKKADMLKIAGDEDLTSEEDFIRLAKIFKRCKQSTERLSAFLAREVVPLEKVYETPKAAQSGTAAKSKK